MTIVVEDGTMVANANSYVSVADVRAYALARNKAVPSADADIEKLLIQAVDFIEARRDAFKGVRVNPLKQLMQWPRANVLIDNFLFPYNKIPVELKNAQCQLVVDQFAGIDLFPNQTGKFAVRERIEGAVEVQYSEKLRTSATPQLTLVENFLAPLISYSNAGSSIPLVRC